jgi:hypothetical protein
MGVDRSDTIFNTIFAVAQAPKGEFGRGRDGAFETPGVFSFLAGGWIDLARFEDLGEFVPQQRGLAEWSDPVGRPAHVALPSVGRQPKTLGAGRILRGAADQGGLGAHLVFAA